MPFHVKSAALNARLAAQMSLCTRQHPMSCQTTITVRSANGNSEKLVAAGVTHPETVRIMIAALQSLLENMRAAGSDLGTDFWTFKVVSLSGHKPSSRLGDLIRVDLSPSTRATTPDVRLAQPQTTKFDPDRGNPGWFAAKWEQVAEEQQDAGERASAQVRWSWFSRSAGERNVEQGKDALVTTFEEYDAFPPPSELAVDDHLIVTISAS
ncbi:hypothetical protein JCM8208_001059 [Rhodotorula glutinis]